MGDGRKIRMKDTFPEDIKKTLMRLAKDVYCEQWYEIG